MISLPRWECSNRELKDALNILSEHLEKALNRRVDVGPGLLAREDGNETIIEANIAPGGGGEAGRSYPFDATVIPDEVEGDGEPTTGKVRLVVGTVNNLMPTNMLDEFPISLSDFYYIVVSATSDGENITSSTISVRTTEATPQVATPAGMPILVDIVVGVIKDGVPYRTVGLGSIRLTGAVQFTVQKELPIEPGELPYVQYNIWEQGIL